MYYGGKFFNSTAYDELKHIPTGDLTSEQWDRIWPWFDFPQQRMTTPGYENWIENSASISLNLGINNLIQGQNKILIWPCKYYPEYNDWKCGCDSTADTCRRWTAQAFDYNPVNLPEPEQPPEVNVEETCGDSACNGGESCSSCEADCGVCQTCGNEIVEGTETCDGTDYNLETCQSQGFDDGLISCSNCNFDTSACYNLPVYTSFRTSNSGNPGGLNTETDSGALYKILYGGWSQLIGPSLSSNEWSSIQSIPFDFYFFGELVTEFKVSANGVITFDTSTSFLPSSNRWPPTTSLPKQSIACYWDQFTSAPPTGSDDYIMSKVFGTAPNRQLWINWDSFEYGLGPGVYYATFSCVFEESTNNIYFVDSNYHGSPVGRSESPSLGIQYDSYVGYLSYYAFFSSGTGDYEDNDYVTFTTN